MFFLQRFQCFLNFKRIKNIKFYHQTVFQLKDKQNKTPLKEKKDIKKNENKGIEVEEKNGKKDDKKEVKKEVKEEKKNEKKTKK